MIVKQKLDPQETNRLFEDSGGTMLKIVVDIARGILSAGCELHIDCADELLQDGSQQKDLWGANIYQDKRIDFVSLINIRPKDHNPSMQIEDEGIRKKVEHVIRALV